MKVHTDLLAHARHRASADGMHTPTCHPLRPWAGGLIPLAIFFFLTTLTICPSARSEMKVALPPLTGTAQSEWQEKRFVGQTSYTPVQEDGHDMLRADSRASASGLFLKMKIDLRQTPILNWHWKVEKIMPGLDERQKAGDDFAARIYVVAEGGLAFWRTRALSYVWSNSQPVGALWPNPFTANAVLIAARSGNKQLGTVVSERHNVREDWLRAFGEDIAAIDAIAIMTDSDNSGLSATALYATPWFSEK